MENSIFEVSREEYKNFIETIKPEARNVETVSIDKDHEAVKLFSKKTNKCFASRVHSLDPDSDEREKYYIFELPDADESLPPVPKIKVILDTPEQVEKLFKGIEKMKENKTND